MCGVCRAPTREPPHIAQSLDNVGGLLDSIHERLETNL